MSYPRYVSSRNRAADPVSFETALLAGLAPDGGLYLPTAIPALPENWRAAPSLAELGTAVLSRWLGGEVPEGALRAAVTAALDFPVPLVRLGDDLWVLELFHGPTLSFKDFGARLMARLMGHFLTRRGERRIVLVATSGDTGSAVADGFAGQPNITVVIIYPQGLVSPVQERQLIVARPGVHAFKVAGTFDDCQELVKAAFMDTALADLPLSSANSINIGRLLPQSLYYLWAARHFADPITFCVPSGNLGNLTGGVLAQLMGLPVKRFIAAHNANDYFPKFLRGLAEPFAFAPTIATLSNAMDVGAPSNFERLYQLQSDLPSRIWATSVHDQTMLARLRWCYERFGYLLCPHTSVGLEAIERYRQESGDLTPTVLLATAHPAKFPEVVQRTLGLTAPPDPALTQLWQQPVSVTPLEADPAALRTVLRDLATR